MSDPGELLEWTGFTGHLSSRARADGVNVADCLPGRGYRPFGGHLVAQALLEVLEASQAGMEPLSLHAHFLAAGDAREQVEYTVESLRTGRSFEHWTVLIAQGERLLTHITVVLHVPETSPQHQVAPRRKDNPDSLPDVTLSPREGTRRVIRSGLDIRQGRRWTADSGHAVPFQDTWYRCKEILPPGWGPVILAWCSDLELAWTVDLPYRENVRSRAAASLDHTIHFHRSFDPSGWFCYEQESPCLVNGRGLVTGRIFSAAGELVASISQHTLLRLEFESESSAAIQRIV